MAGSYLNQRLPSDCDVSKQVLPAVVETPTATVQAVVAALLLSLLRPWLLLLLLLPWMREQVHQLPLAWLELTWNQLAVFGNLR